jgi:hypothetical protein
MIRAILSAFDWSKISSDSDLQFKYYLMGASFITLLVRLGRLLDVGWIGYDETFVAVEFLGWLRKAVGKENSNLQIVKNGLDIFGSIVNGTLSDEALYDYYRTLAYYMGSGDGELSKISLRNACRVILSSYKGCNGLLYDISNSNGFSAIPVRHAVSAILGIINMAYISSDVGFSGESAAEVRLKMAECLSKMKHRLCMASFMFILMEEALAGRPSLIDIALDGISGALQCHKVEEVLALTPICLVIADLEKTKAGSVEKLLKGVFAAVNSLKYSSGPDDDAFVAEISELLVDLLIYSAHLIEWKPYIAEFERILDLWNIGKSAENCQMAGKTVQHILYAVMRLNCCFLRWPHPEVRLDNEEMNGPVFAIGADRFLVFGSKKVMSVLPVGRFQWEFEPVPHDTPSRELSEDVSVCYRIPNASEFEQQKSFSSKLTSYFDLLYQNRLPDFGVQDELCRAENFDHADEISLTPNDVLGPSAQELPNGSIGNPTVAFASSIGLLDVVENSDFCPEVSAHGTASRIWGSLAAKVTSYRYKVHVNLLWNGSEISGHFADFRAGLGFMRESSRSIVYFDSRREIEFHDEGQVRPVCVVWRDGMTLAQFMQSFRRQSHLRIEISSGSNGLFCVWVKVPKANKLSDFVFHKTLVSKRALPAFVLGQIMSVDHLIRRREGKVEFPVHVIGEGLREFRAREFVSRPTKLLSAKVLFEVT